MLISTLALLVLSGAPMQDDSAAEADLRSPIASTSPSRTISARPPSVTNGPTRTVCSWKRAMGSTIQQRVCRKVPLNSSQRERMSTDMMRDMQGSRWGERPAARSPGGRPVG
ncbi:Uncharacterised protein [Brevundimonas diminuta]|uniref:hypothetical protein n=1 Tax=Brevundimonas diminuta TaxID=293 RepID=UPI000207EBCC|nr:hypothetical protein [Brevundimonas diminuta]EGF96681.1 hypothetical protein BDIM_04880 [Brevundimonas diminuta ATCC 11568]OWR17503.1 hypothetical protein CD944_13745 [Brevundimonas diminuta]WQE44712.1 hypothetical protein U0020_14125 [Brevundimonas diminuta]SPU45546.1 Uncharacterised protein [Brevundimonas diminuta]SUW17228.1 Uncharacterised protein [Brevundimonas diminuta]